MRIPFGALMVKNGQNLFWIFYDGNCLQSALFGSTHTKDGVLQSHIQQDSGKMATIRSGLAITHLLFLNINFADLNHRAPHHLKALAINCRERRARQQGFSRGMLDCKTCADPIFRTPPWGLLPHGPSLLLPECELTRISARQQPRRCRVFLMSPVGATVENS